MRALLQHVSHAAVHVDDKTIGAIGAGLVVLVGVAADDSEDDINQLAKKILNLRIFKDEDGKFNLSALDVRAELLVISQFTLYADTRRGRRPGFTDAARPEISVPFYEKMVKTLQESGLKVQTGEFGAHMLVDIHNDGPVTIWLDSRDKK